MRYFDRILAAQQAPEPRPHTPAFRVQAVPHGYQLVDGDADFGFVNTDGWYFFDLWRFAPGGPRIDAGNTPDPVVRDMHTLDNSNINLAGLARFNDGEPPAAVEHRWVQDSGDRLELRVIGHWPRDQRIEWSFRVAYDPAWGKYRYFVDADAWTVGAAGFEPLNMMMVGALHSRGEKRRWSHSLWETPRHGLRHLVHSNALFSGTDYAPQEYGPAWRTKRGPETGAWMAYVGNPVHNPCMVVHDCNAPLYWATCSQLFDEHFIWGDADGTMIDGNHFHFVMHTEYLDLPVDLAESWFAEAEPPICPDRWRYSLVSLPFRMDVVNDLEKPVDVWDPEDCPVLAVSDDPATPVAWVTDAAHSGTHSLRLRGECYHKWQSMTPHGAVCNVDRDATYRFSAWVKTRGVDRFARLELATYEYTNANQTATAVSIPISGDTDWTPISVDLPSRDGAYMAPTIQLYGLGEAWFDDLQLTRV